MTWESLKRSQFNSTNTFTLIPSHHHHCLGIYMLSCLQLSTDRLTTTTTIKTHMVIEPISPSLSSLASNTLFSCKAKQLMGIYQQEEKKMVSRQKWGEGHPSLRQLFQLTYVSTFYTFPHGRSSCLWLWTQTNSCRTTAFPMCIHILPYILSLNTDRFFLSCSFIHSNT